MLSIVDCCVIVCSFISIICLVVFVLFCRIQITRFIDVQIKHFQKDEILSEEFYRDMKISLDKLIKENEL